MKLPTPENRSSRALSQQPYPAFAAHSIPAGSPTSTPSTPSTSSRSETGPSATQVPAAADFSHPWDLATGGFKTLTAKRELPSPQQRRGPITPLPETLPPRSYLFPLVIIACIVVMLLSGGVVLFMTLQP